MFVGEKKNINGGFVQKNMFVQLSCFWIAGERPEHDTYPGGIKLPKRAFYKQITDMRFVWS